MNRARRSQLRKLALRECAEILESAIGVDLGVFERLTREEEDVVEATMRRVSDELFKRSGELHVHRWTPIPLATARYECECGATGRRDKSGAIVEQKTDRRRKSWEAQPMGRLAERKDGAE